MQFYCDKTGFPLVMIPQAGITAHLLPVTKAQFERFLEETGSFDEEWYRTILHLNPRVSCDGFEAEARENIFLTGILPEEVASFARWMGQGFHMPTVQEWRTVYSALAPYPYFSQMLPRSVSETAGAILQRLQWQLQPLSLLDLSLMRGGVVEWVRHGKEWAGLGSPRPEFYPNLFNPLENTVIPIRPQERLKYFGFRLIRRPG